MQLRGFKSFADATSLDVETGITVIVGPNGSGKSNVVDALAWVLGTHSAKKVRGGTMSDVVFAGSPTRSAAPWARVEITIDNSAGTLGFAGLGTSGSAQQFAEVRVAREITRTGDATYEINGQDVRALDVQELLSDTGLGRELHTIVGQGQLDEILNAKPEERRRYIEEAAGILKHRRRRERALRKLEAVDEHTEKLVTILRELRRQLRPLERQAEAADQHAQMGAQLRQIQLEIVAHDLAVVSSKMARQGRSDADTQERLSAAEQAVATRRAEVDKAEAGVERLTPAVDQAQRTYYQLGSLQERLRGTADLVQARRRHLVEYIEEPLAGRPPEELRASADRLDRDRDTRQSERDESRVRMEGMVAERRKAELVRREHEQLRQQEARRRAEARERVLRWEGEVSAMRGSLAATDSELGRVSSQRASLDDRVVEAEQDVQTVHREIQDLDVSEVDITAVLEGAEEQVAVAQEQVDQIVEHERQKERERGSLAARAEAMRAALAERSGGNRSLLEARDELDGLLGQVAEFVRVDEALGNAMSAALGTLGEAVVATTPQQARRAISWLREFDGGGATVLPARLDVAPVAPLDDDAKADFAAGKAVAIGQSLHPADDSDRAAEVTAALEQILATTYLVPDWDRAVLLHGRHPSMTFVTPDGDLAGPRGYRGGQAPSASAVITATAADDAERRARQLAAQLDQLAIDGNAARATLDAAKGVMGAATDRINASDAAITASAERLARLNRELVALSNQREVVSAQEAELREALARDRAALSELNARGPEAADEQSHDEGPDLEAERLDALVESARELELEARVGLERITEQVRHLENQAAELRREAEEVEVALAEAARRREARRAGIARCATLATVCREALTLLGTSIDDAGDHRDQLTAELAQQKRALAAGRAHLDEAEGALTDVREHRHRADLRRAELEHVRDQLLERLAKEFAIQPEELMAEFRDAIDADRPALVETEDVLTRKLGLLGRINPLALEEFKALEARHQFLAEQLEDLRQSKRDLEEVVVAVDDRIREVFADAYHDIAREFHDIFQTVFPGGEGRLVLTDPDDMLTTGIEVEGRPPGKKITRLSLLSGGERSLTVLAFVFAIFRARPSPFYVLDEVDAALDDVNLQRLLTVIESFRGSSQIIMVTHQKRSMEIADVLYGITMGPDAVTKVVAQRFDDLDAEGLLANA